MSERDDIAPDQRDRERSAHHRRFPILGLVALGIAALALAATAFFVSGGASDEEIRDAAISYRAATNETVSKISAAAVSLNQSLAAWPDIVEAQHEAAQAAVVSLEEAQDEAQAIQPPEGFEEHYGYFTEGVRSYSEASKLLLEAMESLDEDRLTEAQEIFGHGIEQLNQAHTLMEAKRRELKLY